MNAEIGLLKAIWPLLLLLLVACVLVWPNLGRKRHQHPAKESDIDYSPRRNSERDTDRGGDSGGD